MGQNFFQRDDRDTKFLLFEHLGVEKLLEYDAFKDFTLKDLQMIADEGVKVCREVLGPTNQDGDRIGATFENGRVTVPESFHSVWKVMAENGWMALAHNPEYGGQGLPVSVAGVYSEFFIGANMAMMSYPGLAVGNGRLIENFGTEEDKAMFVEKMYTGKWAGTMCLTEPNAGSDVGYILTTAKPSSDSDDPRIYKIEGTKQFITCGHHDLTENIIHLVLAKIEGGPPGTKGISLFLVPDIWVNPDGSLGEPNDTACTGIEHKMGIHGSSTCSLSFGENGGCRGILLGKPHSGMSKMFQMMNEARISTGAMAHAQAANAYDTARQYAKERIQGALFTDVVAQATGQRDKGELERQPIIKHEDVRRMLMNLKSGTEAMRAMIGKLYFLLDVSEHDPDEDVKKAAFERVELLTPLVKSYCTDFSYNLIRDAIQILGGVGYCGEFPVEQYARDCKILSIWEGTNYIQSLDLVGRKLSMEQGAVFQRWIEEVMKFTKDNKEDADFASDTKLLFKASKALGEITMSYMQYFGAGKLQLIPLSATRFLDCMAEVFMAQLILEQGIIARDKLKDADPESESGIYYRGKIESAHYFCRNILVNVFSRKIAFEQEDTSALDIPEEAF
ncbi:MAG: acyl-CoA dehydrogenase [Deltaproteobacteria bacterium]|nr:acyl-CoA dehydrogenase [Deltaproteobacteria bacterium]